MYRVDELYPIWLTVSGRLLIDMFYIVSIFKFDLRSSVFGFDVSRRPALSRLSVFDFDVSGHPVFGSTSECGGVVRAIPV